MNRGDMPATGNDMDVQTAHCMSEFGNSVTVDGLGRWRSGMTIREQMAVTLAAAWLQGQLSWSDGSRGGFVTATPDEVADEGIAYADALLAKLEETKK